MGKDSPPLPVEDLTPLQAAAELGYRGPDAAARMLRSGHMGAIGLLFTEDLRFVFTDPDTTKPSHTNLDLPGGTNIIPRSQQDPSWT